MGISLIRCEEIKNNIKVQKRKEDCIGKPIGISNKKIIKKDLKVRQYHPPSSDINPTYKNSNINHKLTINLN